MEGEGKMKTQLERMVEWEEGRLGQDETVELFQGLIDQGLCWRLQGCYGRMAQALIDQGLCSYRVPQGGER